MEEMPERHIECSDCRKPISVIYTEIVGKMTYRLSMCSDCPILKKKLHGSRPQDYLIDSVRSSLCCGNCKTSQDEVRRGAPLGCSMCYEVFDELLTQELMHAERLSIRKKTHKRPSPLHLGRRPGEITEISETSKLMALQQALGETLSREDYEQAAWLRDQIKKLTEESDEKEDT